MKRILRPLLIILGLVAFALAVWFGGPLVGIAEVYVLASVWSRLLLIGLVWGAVGLFYLIRWLRRRRAEKALEEAIVPEGPTGDGEVLGEKLQEALSVLRRSSGSSAYLYELPWYVIIGPPGAGKTTALLNSGIKFPLAESGGAVPGSGGTRYCDWWFAEEAVLIDTAGRYTTHDSDAEADRESWMSFLDLLKRNRPRQPVNGVIVAISLEDILQGDADSLAAHAAAIRDRLMELYEVFRVEVPVYVLFTKADLVAGFTEFFGSFSASRRQKVWGATFRPASRKEATLPHAGAEFDALLSRLSAEVTDRMNEEPDGVARIAIFGFPAQVAMLKDRVLSLLEGVFGSTRYKVNAVLRGFYFTSGTQEGTPIDQVLGAMERSFGDMTAAGSGASGRGKSFFLHDLLRKVIFAEAGWVSQDSRAVRREGILRYGTIAMLVIGALVLAGLWGNSLYRNHNLVRSAEAAAAQYSDEARLELESAEIADPDLTPVLPLLRNLSTLPTGYAEPEDAGTWQEGFGLSQREALGGAAQAAYRDGLERHLRPRLILHVENRIAEDIRDNNLLSLYEALKVYKLLGHAAPAPDDPFIVAWFVDQWSRDPAYRGAGPMRELRQEMEAHLWAMLDLSATQSQARVDLNGALVARAEQILSLMNLEDQAWLLVMGGGGPQEAEPFNIGLRAGPDAELVFETLDGRALDELTVSATFTYAGFHEYFLPRLAEVATKLETEQWVLGARAEAADVSGELQRLGPAMMNRYAREFTKAWNAALDNLQLRPMAAGAPQFLALNAASDPRQSPILQLVEAINRETRLTAGFSEEGGFGAGMGQLEGEGAEVAGMVGEEVMRRMRDRASGMSRIGFDVLSNRRSQNRADSGGEGDGQGAAPLPGANVEAQFSRWHDLTEELPEGRPIDVLLADLQSIYRLLLTSTAGAGQAPANLGQELSTQAALLTRHISRLPPQLARMIQQAADEFAGDAANTTLAALNEKLNNEVTQVCESLIPDSYPFDGRANRDLPVAEFARLFAPDGVIDGFFKQELLPHANIGGEEWEWKQDSPLGSQMSPATLKQFQRAAAIRDAYFPAGNSIPGFDVTIRQTAMHPDADAALLEINGQVITTQQSGSLAQSLFWPAGGGGGSASVQLSPELRGRESEKRVAPGPWALMRLINSGRPRPSGSSVNIRLDVGGRYVAYNINAASSKNPFFLRELWDFRCPRGL